MCALSICVIVSLFISFLFDSFIIFICSFICSSNVPELIEPTQVYAGENHACAAAANGIVCWGDTAHAKTTVPALDVVTDNDSDGVDDINDALPMDASETLDSDLDGVGNNADPDDDNDGVEDSTDTFPLNSAESLDTDSDGVGNNADQDDDNDGVADALDALPLDSTEILDTDLDGIGNNADNDDDDDGVEDSVDIFPLDETESADSDSDGVGDNSDAFPLDASRSISVKWDGFSWGRTKWGSSDADVIWNNDNWSE